MEEKNIKGISSQHTPPLEAQPTVQGLPGILWTPEPSVELSLPSLIPRLPRELEPCQTPGTIALTLVSESLPS